MDASVKSIDAGQSLDPEALRLRRSESRRVIRRALGISSMRSQVITELDEKLYRRFWWLCVNAFVGVGIMMMIQQVCWDPLPVAQCVPNTGLEIFLKFLLSGGAFLLVYQLLDCQRLQAQISALENGRLGQGVLVRSDIKTSSSSAAAAARRQSSIASGAVATAAAASDASDDASRPPSLSSSDAAMSLPAELLALDSEVDAEQAFLEYVLNRVGSFSAILFGTRGSWPWLSCAWWQCSTLGRCCGGGRQERSASSSRIVDESDPSSYAPIHGADSIELPAAADAEGANAQGESWQKEVSGRRHAVWWQLVLYAFHLPPWVSGDDGFSNKFGLLMLVRLLLLVRLLHLSSPIYRDRLNISRALLRTADASNSHSTALPRFGWQLSLKLYFSTEPLRFVVVIFFVWATLLCGYPLHILERDVQPTLFAVSLADFPPVASPAQCVMVPPTAPNATVQTTSLRMFHISQHRHAAASRLEAAKVALPASDVAPPPPSLSAFDRIMQLASPSIAPAASAFDERVSYSHRFFSSVGGLVAALFVGAQCLLFLWPSDVYSAWQPTLISSKVVCMMASAAGLVLTTLLIGLASMQLQVRTVEDGAMRYTRLGDADEELRHAAACMLQLVFRSRRRQRRLLRRVHAARAVLLHRIYQQQAGANQRALGPGQNLAYVDGAASAEDATYGTFPDGLLQPEAVRGQQSPTQPNSLGGSVSGGHVNVPSGMSLSEAVLMHGIDQVGKMPTPVALPALRATSSLLANASSSSSAAAASGSAAVVVDDSLLASLGEDDDLRQMSRAALATTLKVVAAALVDEQCSCVQEFVLCRQRMQRAQRRLTDLQANSNGVGAAGAMDSGPAAAPPSPSPSLRAGAYRKHSTLDPSSFHGDASFDMGAAEPVSSSTASASATTAQVDALRASVERLQAQVEAQQAMLATILGAVTAKPVA